MTPDRDLTRALLAACPTLGPALAGELDGTPESLSALRARLSAPRPTLVLPSPLDRCRDRELAPDRAVVLRPVPPLEPAPFLLTTATWREAAAALLEARYRGDR